MKKLEMLKCLLNCPDLTDEWHFSYCITRDRNDALTKEITKKRHNDSLLNPTSETALTLFFLGNMDAWKQIGTLRVLPRCFDLNRNKDPRNKDFFDMVRHSEEIYNISPSRKALWNNNRKWLKNIIICDEKEIQQSILLFEFEIMSKAFHSIKNQAFKELSFIDIREKTKWYRFDAVIILPTRKTIVFFESKFTSDITPYTKGYPFLSQMMRGLESAFLLTHHQNSLYNGWKYKYVIICPRKIVNGKVMQYQQYLNAIDESIFHYKADMRKNYERANKKIYQSYFGLFEELTPKSICSIYWDELGETLESEYPGFFSDYFDKLKKARLKKESIENIRSRFKTAGINVDGREE